MNLSDYTILCRDIRHFIIENGGASHAEVLEKFPDSSGALANMAFKRLIRSFTEAGVKRYQAIPIRPLSPVDVKADLSFELDD